MNIEFVVRRAVTIHGIEYKPGDRLDDKTIKPGILTALMHNRRIEQRIVDGPEVSVPVAKQAAEKPVAEKPAAKE